MKVKRVDIPTLPKAFRNDVLKDCRYVIDCTEIEVFFLNSVLTILISGLDIEELENPDITYFCDNARA